MARNLLNFVILLLVKAVAKLLFFHRLEWVHPPPPKPWVGNRLIVVLNHTSLYEWLWAGSVPLRFLWEIATRALVPAADKTIRRPLVGTFFRLVVPNIVPISREADHTWDAVLEKLDDDCMPIIFPEGRMKRADGLDSHGRPMTVRGGVADMLRAMDEGQMLVAYSSGLHHVQVPGQHFPNLFRRIRLRLESLDIAEYKASLGVEGRHTAFKRRVRQDLERRRDLYCPPSRANPVPTAEVLAAAQEKVLKAKRADSTADDSGPSES